MFKLWQHGNGKWYVLYGPRLKKRASSGSRDRAEAETFLAQFIATFNEPVVDEPTVGEILTAYRDDHGKGLRGQDGLRYAVAALDKRIGKLLPAHLSPTIAKRYALERGAKPGTILREIGVLRAALSYAKAHKMIAEKPAIPNPVAAPPPRDRWLTKDEAGKLLKACYDPHMRLFVILGLTTCARSSAILEAKWDQIDFEQRRMDFGRGHGNKRRAFVRLNDDAVEALDAAKKLSCTDYVIEFHGRRIASVKKGFAAACARAGIKDVTPHILRHSAATWMVEAGVPIAEVARMLGDSERTVERVYGKHSPEYLRRASNALQFTERA